MNRHEWQQCTTRVRTIWGDNKVWANAERAILIPGSMLQRIPQGAAMKAISQYEMEGTEFPPSVAKIISRSLPSVSTERPDESECKHEGTRGTLGAISVCAVCLKEWPLEVTA